MAQNPMFNENAFKRAKAAHQSNFQNSREEFTEPMHLVRGEDTADTAMSLQGTINKTFFLLLICVVAGMMSWTNPQAFISYFWLIAIVS